MVSIVEKLAAIRLIHLSDSPRELLNAVLAGGDVVELVYAEGEGTEFGSRCFEKYEEEEHAADLILESPDVEEGLFSCSRCKCRRVNTRSKQTRRGDEATTVFANCVACGFGWTL